MNCVLPLEILIEIEKYITDDLTKHKYNSIINNNVCCSDTYKSENYSPGLSEFAEDSTLIRKMEMEEIEADLYEKFETCCICGIIVCRGCSTDEELSMYSCYDCKLTFCSECNSNEEKLKNVIVSNCSIDNCYYCKSGYVCYNYKFKDTCIECSYKYPDNGNEST